MLWLFPPLSVSERGQGRGSSGPRRDVVFELGTLLSGSATQGAAADTDTKRTSTFTIRMATIVASAAAAASQSEKERNGVAAMADPLAAP